MHTAYGIPSSFANPLTSTPWSLSPYGTQQQVPLQSLQLIPQQLQQLQQIVQIQQQQLQQLLQIVPVQLQQLQQVIQFLPYQLQQVLQQHAQQQFGGGQPLTSVFGQASQSQPYSPFQSLSPMPGFSGPSGQVM